MSVINSDSVRAGASGAVAAGYTIDQSVRFNKSDSPYMTKTFSGAGTSSRRGTLSFWWKNTIAATGGAGQHFFNAGGSGGDIIKYDKTDRQLQISLNNEASGKYITTMKFRDPSAWGHLIFAYDTDNVTAGNRLRIYWNGIEVTDFATETDMALNQDLKLGQAQAHGIGNLSASQHSDYQFDGYMAEFIWIDGLQLTPSSFGETDTSGNWVPVDPSSLTFGDNGFWLDFADSSHFGNDVSGEGNDFTDSGLAANDQVSDSPSDDAENDVGNFATWNPLKPGGLTFSEGNSKGGWSSADDLHVANFAFDPQDTDGFYWEIHLDVETDGDLFGIANVDGEDAQIDSAGFNAAEKMWWMEGTGGGYNDGAGSETHTTSGVTVATDNYVMIAVKGGEIWWGVNGVWNNSGDPSAGTGAIFSAVNTVTGVVPACQAGRTHGFQTLRTRPETWEGTLPTGYKPLATYSYPALAITDPSKYFQVDTFTGTGSELVRTLTDAEGGAVKPDLVWIKDRDTSVEHVLTDSARGATKELNSSSNSNETTVAQGLKSFDTSGYTLGTDGNYNTSSSLNVAWCWNTQGGAGSSNEDGTINTTTTSVGTTQGFSISTYTGTGSNATVGHGLGVTPEFMMVKERSPNSGSWYCYHKDLTTPADQHVLLNDTAGEATGATIWNNTAPTSSVFSVGTSAYINGSTDPYVAYVWAGVEGYSKFGGYEGNGATDGTFVWCGFRPRWVMVKSIDTSGTYDGWVIHDTARDTYNGADKDLAANKTWVEDYAISAVGMDILSNGFKLRHTAYVNAANTYIFAAFAEFPFGGEDVSQARAK